MHHSKWRGGFLSAALITLLAISFIASVALGAYHISISDILYSFSHIKGNLQGNEYVLLNIRLPRACIAVLIGFSLGISGAIIQSLFKNPIAEPGLLGFSSMAAVFVGLGAIVATTIDLPSGLFDYFFILSAFIGSIIACIIVMYVAFNVAGGHFSYYIILLGIAINAIAGASIGLMYYFIDDSSLRFLTMWSMGSISGVEWYDVLMFTVIFIISVFFIIVYLAKYLGMISVSDEFAFSAGVNIKAIRVIAIVLVSMLISASVSFSGIISFVGLISPHISRMMVGGHRRVFFLYSGLVGAIILSASDTLSRTVASPAEVPVGIFTSILGVPIFIWFIFNSKKIS